MKKGVFTVFFMTGITVFFISALALVHDISENRILENQRIQLSQSVMYACNILPEGVDENKLASTTTTADLNWDTHHILEMTKERMRKTRLPISADQKVLLKNSFLSLKDSMEIDFILDDNGEVMGFGFPLQGKGLWGTISAYAVLSADLTKVIGIDFTEQSETPGLGARITESGFKYFFRGLDIRGFLQSPNGEPVIQMVGKKIRSNLEAPTHTVQAITGATQTCNGVINMVNTDLRFYISVIQQNQEALFMEYL